MVFQKKSSIFDFFFKKKPIFFLKKWVLLIISPAFGNWVLVSSLLEPDTLNPLRMPPYKYAIPRITPASSRRDLPLSQQYAFWLRLKGSCFWDACSMGYQNFRFFIEYMVPVIFGFFLEILLYEKKSEKWQSEQNQFSMVPNIVLIRGKLQKTIPGNRTRHK